MIDIEIVAPVASGDELAATAPATFGDGGGPAAEVRRPGQQAREVAVKWLATFRSVNTRDAYARDLIGRRHLTDHARRAAAARPGAPSFFDWCSAQGVDPLDVDRFGITLWLRHLDGHDLTGATVARKVAAVRGFYRYAVDDEQVIDRNPMPDKNKTLHLDPVPTESTTQGLTSGQAAAMLHAARATSPRDAAILAVLYHQGLRASELCSLDTDSIGHDRGHRTITVRGKGRKRRTAALAPPAGREIAAYQADQTAQGMLEVTPALLDDPAAPRPLFTHDGQRMIRAHIAALVERYARAAAVEGKITPHSFRHTCATELLDRGVPLRDVQVFLGHSVSRTTERYDRRREHLDGSPAYQLPGLAP